MTAALDIRMSSASLFDWPPEQKCFTDGLRVEVVGVPSDSGNGIASGARFGPEIIRRASLKLSAPKICGIDHGDIGPVHGCDWAYVLEESERIIESLANNKSRPLIVLGGDHAISYAAVAALHNFGPLNVVWFDAHTDFCPWRGGRWHDHKQVLRRINGLDHVRRILHIGHRGITYTDESALSRKMTFVTANTASKVQAASILEFLPPAEQVYISIDIDAIDPKWAPGTGHPVPGGISPKLLSDLARVITSKRNVIGLDMMEVNPLLDHGDITSTTAAQIISEILSAFVLPDKPQKRA